MSLPKEFTDIYEGNGDFSKLKKINNVLHVVFIVWFGDSISQDRLNALKSLTKNLKCPYILITNTNVKEFEVDEYPYHEAFQYLSGNHKSQYLRSYLLHHYGGGYHNIEYRTESWNNAWSDFKNKNVWIKTRKEKHPNQIGYDVDRPFTKMVQSFYKDLGTMNWVICRDHTNYTHDLLEKIHMKLDLHHESLKKHPSEKEEGYYSSTPFSKVSEPGYPLRWLELMDEHSHILMFYYRRNISFGLPDVEYKK